MPVLSRKWHDWWEEWCYFIKWLTWVVYSHNMQCCANIDRSNTHAINFRMAALARSKTNSNSSNNSRSHSSSSGSNQQSARRVLSPAFNPVQPTGHVRSEHASKVSTLQGSMVSILPVVNFVMTHTQLLAQLTLLRPTLIVYQPCNLVWGKTTHLSHIQQMPWGCHPCLY